MTRILSICSLFLATTAAAQPTPYDDVEHPDPMKPLHASFYPQIRKPVKSFLHIEAGDTISRQRIDRNGNVTEEVTWSRQSKRPATRSLTTYKGTQKIQTEVFGKSDLLQSTRSFRYDAQGRLAEWTQVRIDRLNGTVTPVHDRHWKTVYGANGLVASRYALDAAGAEQFRHDYTYDNRKRIIRIERKQWKDVYTFEGDRLIRTESIFTPGAELQSYAGYSYFPDGQLAASWNKYDSTTYTYDSGRLLTLTHRKLGSNAYKKASFSYHDGLLKRVDIESNSRTLAYAIPWFRFRDEDAMPMQEGDLARQAIAFSYDSQRNVTELRYFTGENYRYSQQFVYEYY